MHSILVQWWSHPVLSWWKTDMCGKYCSIVIVKIGLISFRPLLFCLPFSISFYFRWFRFAFVGFVLFRFHFVDFVSFLLIWFRFVSFSFISFRFVSFRFYFASHFIGAPWMSSCLCYYNSTKYFSIKITEAEKTEHW